MNTTSKCHQTQDEGILKVKDFKCSKHGKINPIPKCPNCFDNNFISKQTLIKKLEEMEKNGTGCGCYSYDKALSDITNFINKE